MNDNEGEQNKRRNKYICPFPKCYLIPEILSIHSDSGKVVLKCSNLHFCELDIFEYFKILDEKSDINPKSSNIDNQEEIDSNPLINILLEKKKKLSDNIKINNLILNAQEKFPNNYKYNKNLINIGKCIEEENCRAKDIDDIIKKEIKDNEINEKDSLQKLEENYSIYLDKHYKQKKLSLNLKGPKDETQYRWLRDDGFKLISKIRFTNLIEINLDNNQINDITPLNDMLLPHLEIIKFGNNQIENITPVANLASKNLSEIYLHNNKIEDLGPFLISNFPLLILRVDNNNKAFNKSSFKEILKKYKNIIIYEVNELNIEDKNKDLRRFEFSSIRDPKIIQKNLFALIDYPNKIKYLILDDNKLEDISILNRLPLLNLEVLDLSLNFITNISVLKKMSPKCPHLKTLYLNDNKINDISPLVKFKEENKFELIFVLTTLTLKNNNININDEITYKILDKLIHEKALECDYEENDLAKSNQIK